MRERQRPGQRRQPRAAAIGSGKDLGASTSPITAGTQVIDLDAYLVARERRALAAIARRLCPLRNRGLSCPWCDHLPLLERHDPLPTDKLVWHAARVTSRQLAHLVERWQR
jgi:hypothetical protein